MENIMKSDYIRLYKIDNLNGGFFFSVTTDPHWYVETQAIGLRGFEILGRAYDEGRRIDVWKDKDGTGCIYTIYKD